VVVHYSLTCSLTRTPLNQVSYVKGSSMDSCLMNERVWMGIHVVRTVESIFPYLNLERKSEADRSLEVVRTGCWVVRMDASWNISFSILMKVQTGIHVVQTDDALGWRASGRYDTSSGRLTGNRKLLTCKSTSSRFPTIFPIFREQNYFLLPYKKILHNRFPYISLYQLNIIFLLLFYSFSLFPTFYLFPISINYTSFILK